MEAPDFVTIDGYALAGTPNRTPEKLWKYGGGEQFVVEDLLDFSNEEEDEAEALAEGSSGDVAGNTTDSSTITAIDSCCNSYSDQNSGDLVGISADLCEPYDQLAELEWLSNFVEESFSSEGLENLQLISGIRPSSSSSSATRGDISAVAAAGDTCLPFRVEAAIPGKIRSKRSRAATPWSSSALLPSGVTSEEVPSPESDVVVPSKAAEGRRCLHCATDKTPQWRTGPMGPKTLCNACGVRYKSGRLVPEYRPASSPTFVVSRHSNSHRKVLELRRQKELQPPQQQFLPPAIAAGYGGGEGFLFDRHAGLDFRRFN